MQIDVDNSLTEKSKKQSRIIRIVIYVILCFLVLVYILPLLWIIMSAMKPNADFKSSPWALPSDFSSLADNFIFAWTKGRLGRATLNSFIVSTVTLIVSLIVGSMAAFSIAKLRWKYSKLVLTYFMIGMMIPIHCVLFSLYTQFASWHLTDSLVGLIIPYTAFSLPITIYIMTGFFESIPNELFEAAVIDGCSVPRLFVTVGLPMAKTGFMVTGLMSFVNNWNELLFAMVFISDDMKKTLPVSLTKFVGPHSTNYTQMFAGIVIAVIPTIIVYCIFANQIVEGLTAGAVKG
ncbi:MAG: carbohydrate ABC transporter permease [Lachnospiraceae bacterium]|nr:carbohydrate ABC transporter permease [Lachnospiraceae bacterium]